MAERGLQVRGGDRKDGNDGSGIGNVVEGQCMENKRIRGCIAKCGFVMNLPT